MKFEYKNFSAEEAKYEDENEDEETKLGENEESKRPVSNNEDIHNDLFEKHKSLKAPNYEKHAQSFNASINEEEFLDDPSIVNNTYTDNFKQKPSKDWNLHEDTDVCFFGIMTHECRNSARGKEQFMPPARFNDGKMYIGTLQK
eukprot:CAMPEP_0205804452 /NCGR_PEP_ID=MMETSP0205-20121125/7373_1 /ASSEMBLY_ACC=CAM_ASM_000278 /TAXON_ID=36767 /ORGANISM="Euplotes focardii, Strain TN1" /LENGTH=143 /DNA_ID=CAMNT_0053074079 /DNA_START=302 /DNA_END=734 /DNA_ORIENTATION=-